MMQPAQDIRFGKFRLDTANECLWQGERPIALRPKAFAVLKLLVERAGLLVTKQEVLDAVWAGTFVGDAVLKDCIRQLRDALADDAAAPAFIETAHRRGYRFIAKLSSDSAPHSAEANRWRSEKATLQSAAPGNEPAVQVLGRDSELERMRR